MIVVRPEAYRQYVAGRNRFVLVVEKALADFFRLEHGTRHEHHATVLAEPGRTLADVLRSDVPENSDVLVVAAADSLLTAPTVEIGPGRTVAAVRTGTGPLALDQTRSLLEALERTDPGEVQRHADALAEALAAAGGLRIEDPLTGSLAEAGFARPTWSRSDVGAFKPGAVQLAPTGRLRLATDVTGTTLSGQIAVKGWPVVHSRTGDDARRHELYEGLTGLSHHPLVLTVDDGTVTDLKAAASGSAAAATALESLFAEDPGHCAVSGVGFGLSPATQPLPFHTEANASATGRAKASVHVVLGALPRTPYQLTLACATSTVTAAGGTGALAGSGTETGEGGRPRRRMNRVTASSCGCH